MDTLVVNARMYAVTPRVGDQWRALFEWIGRDCALALTYVKHAAPAPLEELWSRSDLAAAFMLGYRQSRDGGKENLFAASVGPLLTPRRVIEALLQGDIDVGPLDSYVHDLLRVHEPDTASRLRTVESTAMTPIPPLIASLATP